MDRRRDTALPSSSDDDGEVEDVDMFSPRANLMEEGREESERSDSVDSESSADVIMGIIGFADPVCPPPTLVPTDVVDAPPPPPPPSTPVDTNAWGPDGTSARVRARSRAVSEGTPRGTLEAGTLRSAMPLRSPRSPLRSSRKRVGSVGSGLSEVLQDAEDAWDGVSPRDPLTLEPLCEDNRLVFEFYPPQPCLHADGAASSKPHGARGKGPRSPKSRRSGGVVIRYNLHSLLRYYTTAARLNDPVTGVPLSAQQIRALDRAARRLGVDLGEGGLVALHRSSSRDQEVRQQAILQNYESLGGEMIASMMEHIERSDSDDEDANEAAEMNMAVTCSQLATIVAEYKNEDLEKSYQFIRAADSFIRGPARRPTPRNRRFQAVVEFLKGLWGEADDENLKQYRKNVDTDVMSFSPPSVTSVGDL